MKALARVVLISFVLVGSARVISAPAAHPQKEVAKLRLESTMVDPLTTPRVLERRFGRDTLLYFPAESATAPVALQVVH